jgi:hypothetical protein
MKPDKTTLSGGVNPEESPPEPPAPSLGTAPSEDAERKALEEKYAAPKAFDWSKVKGPGKGRIAKEREERKKQEAAEQSAIEAEDKPLAQLKRQLTRTEKIAASIFFPVLLVVFYFLLRGDPGLGEALSSSERQRIEQESKQEMITAYKALEKQFGADHPEVKQQREMMRKMNVQP